VDALHGLPLAIDHAGAYIRRAKNVFQYLADFHACRQESILDLTVSSLHNRTVATTWKLSLARLSPAAAQLLEYLAFMNPDEIVIDYLRAGATVLPLTLHTALKDPARCRGLVQSLEETSLIRVFSNGDRIWMHRLVQAVVQDGLRSKRAGVGSIAVQIGLQAFPMLDRSLEGLQTCHHFRAQVVSSLDHTVTRNKSSD